MKILRIAVRNIASLSGLQVVDFTVDPLRSAGLFSITGVTGAGKSSLLDAMCLALYDTTPRLARLGRLAEVQGEKPGDPRALLRRSTAEGFAEVSFRGVDDQLWTARWSVRRSHLRVDGSLQAQEMVLLQGIPAPGGPGQPAAAGTRTEVKAAIQEKIGLDFNQFTRAVLLAQNEFSQFLKADDKDRAAILQLLTGTEFFENLSRSAYAKYMGERRELEELRTMMQGLIPLPAAERLAAEQELDAAKTVLNDLEAKRRVREEWLLWYQQLHQLKQQQLQVETDLAALSREQPRISELRSQLLSAELIHRDLKSDRQKEMQISKTLQALGDEIQKLTELEQQPRSQLEEFTKKEIDLIADRQRLNQLLSDLAPKFREAEQLRGNIIAAEASLKNAENELRESQDELTTKQNELGGLREKITQQETALLQIQQKQQAVSRYTPFQNDLSFYENQLKQIVQLRQERQQVTADSDRWKLKSQQQLVVVQKLRDQRQELSDQVERAQIRLAETESNLAPEVHEQALNELGMCRRTLEHLNAFVSSFSQLSQLRLQLEKQITADGEDRARLSSSEDRVPVVMDRIAAARSELLGATQMLSRIRAAIDDVAVRLRTELVAGQECPVCGATEHPYAVHAPDHNVLAVQAAQVLIEERTSEIDGLTRELATLESTIQLLNQRLTKSTGDRAELEFRIQETISRMVEHPVVSSGVEISLSFPPETGELLDRLLQQYRAKIADLENTDRAFRALLSDVDRLRKDMEKARSQLSQHDEQITAGQDALRDMNSQISQLDARLIDVQFRYDGCFKELAPVIAAFPESMQQVHEEPSEFLQQFVEGVTSSRRLQQEQVDIERLLQTEKQHHGHLVQMVQMVSESVNRKQQAVEGDRQRVESLRVRRNELFPGEDPLSVEATLKNDLEQLGIIIQDLQVALTDCRQRMAGMEASKNEKSGQQRQWEKQLEETSAAVNRWIAECQILTEFQRTREHVDAVLSLDEAWFSSARSQLSTYDREVAEFSGQKIRLQQQLDELLNSRTDIPSQEAVDVELQQLATSIQEAKTAVDTAQSVISVDDQRLRDNATRLQQYTELEARIRPWEQLNDLIGSSDGAKFRGIAQRRTLDILLRYANVHLTQLSPRYRLERTAESLNLTVVDREMGDERRSVHSLSGGETFLASLALALGLASLASNRLRIESLFIDEGFGSLDQETLSVAIGALMQLESQGRKVGVISHVSEMSEAIPVQIRIQRQKAGASRIVIPGAREVTVNDDQPATTIRGKSGATDSSFTPQQVAEQILNLLQAAAQSGKSKVSITSLRSTIGCTPAELKHAQQLIATQIEVEGKSLKLKS